MAEKIAKLGIKREDHLMYYVKNGDVWATPRAQPGQPKGAATMVAKAGVEMDYSRYLYYLDGDGDVARKERAAGTEASAGASSTIRTPRVDVELSHDVALVLYEWLRANDYSKPLPVLADADRRALVALEHDLDAELGVDFLPNYRELVALARRNLTAQA